MVEYAMVAHKTIWLCSNKSWLHISADI